MNMLYMVGVCVHTRQKWSRCRNIRQSKHTGESSEVLAVGSKYRNAKRGENLTLAAVGLCVFAYECFGAYTLGCVL